MLGHRSELFVDLRSSGLCRPWLAATFVAVALTACGTQQAQSPDARIRRSTEIVHEPCAIDERDAQRLDVNGDGKADLMRVVKNSKETCRALDLNFDGVIDTWVYLAPDGRVRRRESDFDRDGRIDEISDYRGGVMQAQKHATNLAGQLDTWHFYEQGRLQRSERDANGDSVIDQWWEYPRYPRSNCALVHSDVDGDGRPDPGATVDLCEAEPVNEEATTSDTSAASTSALRPPASAPAADDAESPKP